MKIKEIFFYLNEIYFLTKYEQFSKLIGAKTDGDCGEVVNALDCGSGIRGFDSHQSPQQ
jgi:hypothetical protein